MAEVVALPLRGGSTVDKPRRAASRKPERKPAVLRPTELVTAHLAHARAAYLAEPVTELLASAAMHTKALASMLLREYEWDSVSEVEKSYVFTTALRRIEALSASAARILSEGAGVDLVAEHLVIHQQARTASK
jgi:hypothetical protein